MVSCAVVHCKNNSSKISKNKDGISFHRFPQNKERRQQWVMAINREEGWSATASSTICSEHFESTEFYLTVSGLRRLSVDAVPTINISACQPREPTIAQIEPVDINPLDTEEVIKLKHKVHRLEMIAESRKKRLNLMWQSKKRIRKKMERLKCMIRHLIMDKKVKEKEMGS